MKKMPDKLYLLHHQVLMSNGCWIKSMRWFYNRDNLNTSVAEYERRDDRKVDMVLEYKFERRLK
jgi:hypothetical protein